jgi:hypothetical protein
VACFSPDFLSCGAIRKGLFHGGLASVTATDCEAISGSIKGSMYPLKITLCPCDPSVFCDLSVLTEILTQTATECNIWMHVQSQSPPWALLRQL